MIPPRRIILNIATSQDGFIATNGDGLDWLPQPTDGEDYGLAEFMKSVDCVLIGRRTWDVISQFEEDQFLDFDRHIFSRSTHDAIEYITKLKIKPGKDIWLLGGGILNGECLQAGIIDEIIITQIPIVLDEGIPVFGLLGVELNNSWKEVSKMNYGNGIVRTSWKQDSSLRVNLKL